jgi:ribose/xylose/arabinose/galactoside ABC-type transport system permease subunit
MRRLLSLVIQHRSVPILLVLVVIFVLKAPNFATFENLQNLLLQTSLDGIMVVGTAIALIGGQFDLSIGSILTMSTFLAVDLAPYGPLAVVGGAVLFGVLAGLFNGLLVTKAKVNAFIATLGTMFAVRGLMLLYSGGFPKSTRIPGFTHLAEGALGPVPYPVIIFALLAVVGHVLLTRTKTGRIIYAVGANPEFCRLSGVSVNRYLVLFFILTGGTAGLSGAILASRLGAASPVLGQQTALVVVSAVILGGVSLYGGRGSIPLAIEGVFTISVLGNGMNLIGVSPYPQQVIRGLILIIVVVLDAILEWRRRRAGLSIASA